MNKRVKTKWLKALRSGTYAQEQKHLHGKRGGYCCLGVLCDILDHEGENKTWRGSASFPPDELLNSVGLPPAYKLEGRRDNPVMMLAKLNDDMNWNFSQIANWIETNL